MNMNLNTVYEVQLVFVLKEAPKSDHQLLAGGPWAHMRHPIRPCESRDQAGLSVDDLAGFLDINFQHISQLPTCIQLLCWPKA